MLIVYNVHSRNYLSHLFGLFTHTTLLVHSGVSFCRFFLLVISNVSQLLTHLKESTAVMDTGHIGYFQ